MIPSTVTLFETTCGSLNSLFGSFSATVGSAPMRNVRRSDTPVADLTRMCFVPSEQSAASLSFALTWVALTTANSATSIPGS